MTRKLTKFYILKFKDLIIQFFKFKDFLKYINKYPKSRITLDQSTNSCKNLSIVYSEELILPIGFSNTQINILKSLFSDRVVEVENYSISKYQQRKLDKNFINQFNQKNYFQQQSYIRRKALSYKKAYIFMTCKEEPFDYYFQQYVNYLKTLSTIVFKEPKVLCQTLL